MDLGCLDLGCIEKQVSEIIVDSDKNGRDRHSPPSVRATSKVGKNKALKETAQSNANALNKFTSQIKKPPHRKTSPLGWFPRKKVDSYLKRKIKLLQEVGGMNSTLDETLGDSNPHYSKVLREKIAVREAAIKAIEARKAAMVEASWCRILRAARVDTKEADVLLLQAERIASEALEAATNIGVIMYDRPDCPPKHYEIETSSVNGGRSLTHTVTATFETAFEVDKQVAAAVKAAFLGLANCPSTNKDEFKDLLRKISQNPDTGESRPELLEVSLERESGCNKEVFPSQDSRRDSLFAAGVLREADSSQISEKFNMTKLVDMMQERLLRLQEDELSSLATIVATCGLNAALAEADSAKQHLLGSAADSSCSSSFGGISRRMSSFNTDGPRRKQAGAELPSLDKFLVKRLTRLEREVQESKNSRRKEVKEKSEGMLDESDYEMSSFNTDEQTRGTQVEAELPSLDKFLVKRLTRLERQVQEAKNSRRKEVKGKNDEMLDESDYEKSCAPHDARPSEVNLCPSEAEMMEHEEKNKNMHGMLQNDRGNSITCTNSSVSDFGSMLKKHSSKLDKEIEEAKGNRTKFSQREGNKSGRQVAVPKDMMELPSLDKFLVKHVSKLEREVQEAKNRRELGLMGDVNATDLSKKATSTIVSIANLEMDLSCFEGNQVGKENVDLNKNRNGEIEMKQKEIAVLPHQSTIDCSSECLIGSASLKTAEEALSPRGDGDEVSKESGKSLDEILIKPVHRLERKKMQAQLVGSEYGIQRNLKKKEGNSFTDTEGLEKVLVKHVSRLEKQKMRLGANEEEILTVKRRDANVEPEKIQGSLDQILVKHNSKLETEKKAAAAAAAELPDGGINHFATRQEARQRELQEAWGGMTLGNSMRPHLSRLQREKAAWLKAEEEQRRGEQS